jgi:putative transposase
MRSMGLTPPSAPQRARTTLRDESHPVAPNELARDFNATRPNERWVTDITYVWSDEGWVYLAAILDLFSRAVVGWAVDTNLSTHLPLTALRAAVRRRRPEAGLLTTPTAGASTPARAIARSSQRLESPSG